MMFTGLFHLILNPPKPQVTRLFREMRPGLREMLLRAHLPPHNQPLNGSRSRLSPEVEARLSEAERICSVLAWRHVQAAHAEKQGRLDTAIRLYEQNVADGDLSTMSYERLRMIYLAKGRFTDARRVCEAYISALNELADRDPTMPLWLTGNYERFQRYINEDQQLST
ncbi:MAG TPA: hypothetical protein VGK87_17575 [Anaerolineae bacterium]|jgi:hypothetical protein